MSKTIAQPGANRRKLKRIASRFKVFMDPWPDHHLGEQTMQRNDLYRTECAKRKVKFLPAQILRSVFEHAGVPGGSFLTPRGYYFDSFSPLRAIKQRLAQNM